MSDELMIPARNDRPVFWPGNAAKTRILNRIVASVQGRDVTIFDYGSGGGGFWPDILDEHGNIRLICYEPNEMYFETLKKRLSGRNAVIFGRGDEGFLGCKAEFIVSFSVLEHVVDRIEYLRKAKACLSTSGTFFLNYDDGHFRYKTDLLEIGQWKSNLFNMLASSFSIVSARFYETSYFQRRVLKKVIDGMVQEAGFRIVEIRYENNEMFKDLSRTIPEASRGEFAVAWARLEEELNERWRFAGDCYRGDTINLWRCCLSRSLELRHDDERTESD